MEESRQRWHILFSGRVQHVGFRYTAYYLARGLGLTGWVQNLPDGRVEIELQGARSQLRRMLLRLKEQKHMMISSRFLTLLQQQVRRLTCSQNGLRLIRLLSRMQLSPAMC